MNRQTKIGIYGRYRSPGPDDSALIKAQAMTQATATVGKAVVGYQEQKIKQELTSQRNDIINESILKFDEYQRQFKDDEAGFNSATDGWIKGKLDNAPNAIRGLLEADLTTSKNRRITKIRDFVDKQAFNENQATFVSSLSTQADEGIGFHRDGSVDAELNDNLFQESLDEGVESGFITALQSEAYKKNYESRKVTASVMGQIDRYLEDPTLSDEDVFERGESLYKEIESGDWGDATGEQKDAVLRNLGTKLNSIRQSILRNKAERTLETSEEIYSLEMLADTGPEGENFDGFQDRVSALYYGGAFGEPGSDGAIAKRVSLERRAKASRDKITEAEKDKYTAWEGIASALEGEKGVPMEQKHVDSFYEDFYLPSMQGRVPEDQRQKYTADFIEKTRMVPSLVKRTIGAQIRSGDIGQIKEAMDLTSRIDSLPGMLDTATSKSDKAYMQSAITLSEYMSDEEAIAEANRRIDPQNQALISGRAQGIKDIEKDDEDFYDEATAEALESWAGGDVVDSSFTYQDLKRDFKELFKHYYLRSGEKENAKELAMKDMQTYWSESEFGFMQNKPELFYNMTGEEVRDDLYGALRENIFGQEFQKDKVFLLSDDQTDREAKTGKPTYRVFYQDTDGKFNFLDQRYLPDEEKVMGEKLTRQEREFELGRREKADTEKQYEIYKEFIAPKRYKQISDPTELWIRD